MKITIVPRSGISLRTRAKERLAYALNGEAPPFIRSSTNRSVSSDIVAVGKNAGAGATGTYSAAEGYYAGQYAGSYFAAQGYQAGYGANSNFAAQGYEAGSYLGSNFAAQGYYAGNNAGDRFIAIGYLSTDTTTLSSPTGINDSIAIGYESDPRYNGHFLIKQANLNSKPLIQGDLTSGKVAIGTSAVSGVATPTALSDGATKGYVDTAATLSCTWESVSTSYCNGYYCYANKPTADKVCQDKGYQYASTYTFLTTVGSTPVLYWWTGSSLVLATAQSEDSGYGGGVASTGTLSNGEYINEALCCE